ncbi:MAG: hypothetical protein LPK09_14690 [Hymenobacteraceae bacterium]|nr:hypothetical protein [Hymenobacteraceae bacterium]
MKAETHYAQGHTYRSCHAHRYRYGRLEDGTVLHNVREISTKQVSWNVGFLGGDAGGMIAGATGQQRCFTGALARP